MKLLDRLDAGFAPQLVTRGTCDFIGTALAIGLAAAGAAGSIGGAAISASAAGHAASTQANAANYAAQLQKEAADQSLAEQRRQFDISQGNITPWLSTGRTALSNLRYLMGLPSSQASTAQAQGSAAGPTVDTNGLVSVMPTKFNLAEGDGGWNPSSETLSADPNLTASQTGAPVTSGTTDLISPQIGNFGDLLRAPEFVAPTNVTEQNDPGYQFRLQQAAKAVQASAAAKGTLLSGGTLRALNRNTQDYASNEYQNVYGRALNQYGLGLQNRADTFNRFSLLAGTGQTAATNLGSLGQNYANNVSNILTSSATQQGQQANNAAAARASGYIGGANAWGSALGSSTNGLMNLILMNQLFKQPGSLPSQQSWDDFGMLMEG